MSEINDLQRLIKIHLQTHRYQSNPGGLDATRALADYLLKIYRLEPGEAPALEALAAAYQQ